MITLGIDTTAKAASAALAEDGRIISEFYTNVGLQHSRTLMPMVESLFACCAYTLSQVDRIGITVGPGSFTGVRIGVAAVKGMAMPQKIPCVAFSTLEILAHNIPETDALLCPVMDARCQQVYNALFCWQNRKLIRLCHDRAITIEALQQELSLQSKPVIWLGDGASLCYDALEHRENHILAPEHLRWQRASQAALLAQQAEQLVSPEALSVSYLRPPQAVRTRLEQTSDLSVK